VVTAVGGFAPNHDLTELLLPLIACGYCSAIGGGGEEEQDAFAKRRKAVRGRTGGPFFLKFGNMSGVRI